MMKKFEYRSTYRYLSEIDNIVSYPLLFNDHIEYFINNTNPIYLIKPFYKYSVFHRFIDSYVTHQQLSNNENVSIELFRTKSFSRKFFINELMNSKGIAHLNFDMWYSLKDRSIDKITQNDIIEYLETFKYDPNYVFNTMKLVEEIFHLAFMNRLNLGKFNELISRKIETITRKSNSETAKHIRKNNRLKRSHIPIWAKTAVFHRDKGKCIFCRKDLTNTITTLNKLNYDHIVPLSKFGINDISNLQLLCAKCNSAKSDKEISTSSYYETWYTMKK